MMLKNQRNQISHQIRRTSLKEAEERLNDKVKEVERLKDGAPMFKAAQHKRRRNAVKPVFADKAGQFIINEKEAATAIGQHFDTQLNNPSAQAVPQFDCPPRPLSNPITCTEVAKSLMKLNNGRASGEDDTPAELLKYGGDAMASTLSSVINGIFSHHQSVEVGGGVLIPLQ
eukprot:scpid95248/ scgid30453/ 